MLHLSSKAKGFLCNKYELKLQAAMNGLSPSAHVGLRQATCSPVTCMSRWGENKQLTSYQSDDVFLTSCVQWVALWI